MNSSWLFKLADVNTYISRIDHVTCTDMRPQFSAGASRLLTNSISSAIAEPPPLQCRRSFNGRLRPESRPRRRSSGPREGTNWRTAKTTFGCEGTTTGQSLMESMLHALLAGRTGKRETLLPSGIPDQRPPPLVPSTLLCFTLRLSPKANAASTYFSPQEIGFAWFGVRSRARSTRSLRSMRRVRLSR